MDIIPVIGPDCPYGECDLKSSSKARCRYAAALSFSFTSTIQWAALMAFWLGGT